MSIFTYICLHDQSCQRENGWSYRLFHHSSNGCVHKLYFAEGSARLYVCECMPGLLGGMSDKMVYKYILYPQIRVQRMMEIQKRGEEDILGHWLVVNQRYYHHRQALMTGPLPPPECAHVFRGKKRNGGFTAVEHEEHLCGTHLCSLLQGLRFTKRLLQTKEKTFSVKDQ